jgi:hypothetical protein
MYIDTLIVFSTCPSRSLYFRFSAEQFIFSMAELESNLEKCFGAGPLVGQGFQFDLTKCWWVERGIPRCWPAWHICESLRKNLKASLQESSIQECSRSRNSYLVGKNATDNLWRRALASVLVVAFQSIDGRCFGTWQGRLNAKSDFICSARNFTTFATFLFSIPCLPLLDQRMPILLDN